MSRTRRGKRANKAYNKAQSLINGDTEHRKLIPVQCGKCWVYQTEKSHEKPKFIDLNSPHRKGYASGC